MYSPIWASTMLPVQRHQKPKGFKVKHVVQITMITVVLTWVIYQLNHSQRTAHISYDDDEVGGLQDSRTGVMIGWKGLKPNLQATEQEQEQEQEVDRDELADEERDEVNAFDAAEGTAEESVRDDVGFVEDTAKTGGDLQDEEQVQDVEVVETDEQDNDQFDGSDLDQQREDADLQQDVGIDFTDLKNEEGRSNWDKSAQDSGNEDLEFNEGLRGGTTTEQPAEKTETKATDSAMNLSTVVDGDEKVKENEVSHVEEVGKNTILRTKDSESMVNNKWEDSTMTSKPEQGSSQELGKQPETETMNLESEKTQVQEKLGQDSDKSNDQTSKDVLVPEETAEESVRDDVDSMEHTAKAGGDLQDEEQVQDVEVVETDKKASDQFHGGDLDQQREDADLQQDVGIDCMDLKNEEGRSNWDKSAQDSGNEDLEFNDGLRGGTITEQPAEKTETKATDSAMNLSTVVDGDEKVKENEVSHVEEVGKNTILRTKDSESMVNNKWEDSTMTSKPEQGSSQELGKQPETETMNLESEGTQVQEKLGQDSDKINDETSKDVIVSGESHSQETTEVRKGDDSSQEQGNHEPKKETETENVGDGSQGRKEYQMNDWHKEGTEESNKEIESQQQAEALNSENVQSSSEEEDKADEFTRQRMEIEKSIQGFSKVKDEIHNIDTDSQQGSRDGGAQESQETKEKVVVDQGLEGVLWDHRSYEEKGENRSEEQKGEEKGDRASQENQSSITADDKSGAVGKDSHETGPKHSYTDNGQGRDGSDWTNTSTQNTEVQEIQDSTAMWQVVSQVGDSQNNQESGRDAELMKPEGQLTNEDENNAADTQQQSGHSWIDPTIQEVADKHEENKE